MKTITLILLIAFAGCAPSRARTDMANEAEGHAAAELATYTSGLRSSPTPDGPVDPVGPVDPSNCDNCKSSDWPGWLGDGQPRTPCPVCNADGKLPPRPRAKATSTKFWSPKPKFALKENS